MKKGYHKKGRRFVNPHIDSTKRSLIDIALWQLGFYNDKKKQKKRPKDFKYPNSKRKLRQGAPQVTWINHCTFLVKVGSLNVLTDPIWGERCSPLSFLGPKRRHIAPMALEDLPEIDIVLISHDHYDHLCRDTVLKLQEKNSGITWVVPLGVRKRLEKLGMKHIIEMSADRGVYICQSQSMNIHMQDANFGKLISMKTPLMTGFSIFYNLRQLLYSTC